MSRALKNPLQSLVERAASTLPAETGRVASQQARIDRRTGVVVVLADISASMGGPAWGGQRKIDILRDAVAGARAQRQSRLFVFSDVAREVDTVPDPERCTNLASALDTVRQLDPGVTLVVSDGEPDNAAAALEAAGKFRGAIDVLYIGPEANAAAIAFMRRLAARGGGGMSLHDVARIGSTQKLLGQITELLN